MRFPAPLRCAALAVTVVVWPTSIIADTSANCDDPPGGRIVCEDTQAAFCKVVRGKVDGYCKTPPNNLASTDEISAWTLSEATGERVSAMKMKTSPFSDALKDRRWKSGDTVVTFTLPKSRSPFGIGK